MWGRCIVTGTGISRCKNVILIQNFLQETVTEFCVPTTSMRTSSLSCILLSQTVNVASYFFTVRNITCLLFDESLILTLPTLYAFSRQQTDDTFLIFPRK